MYRASRATLQGYLQNHLRWSGLGYQDLVHPDQQPKNHSWEILKNPFGIEAGGGEEEGGELTGFGRGGVLEIFWRCFVNFQRRIGIKSQVENASCSYGYCKRLRGVERQIVRIERKLTVRRGKWQNQRIFHIDGFKHRYNNSKRFKIEYAGRSKFCLGIGSHSSENERKDQRPKSWSNECRTQSGVKFSTLERRKLGSKWTVYHMCEDYVVDRNHKSLKWNCYCGWTIVDRVLDKIGRRQFARHKKQAVFLRPFVINNSFVSCALSIKVFSQFLNY